MVPLLRSIKDVLNCLHPTVIGSRCCAGSRVPQVSLPVTSTTRLFCVRWITVALHRSGHTSTQALPLLRSCSLCRETPACCSLGRVGTWRAAIQEWYFIQMSGKETVL